MGDSKRRKEAGSTGDSLYPWRIFCLQSKASSKLTLLCIGRENFPMYRIIEGYYEDELQVAIAAVQRLVSNQKRSLNAEFLTASEEQWVKDFKWFLDKVPTSRSTFELRLAANAYQNAIVSVTSGKY